MLASFSHRRSRMVNKWHLGSGREEERYPRKLSSTSGVWGQGGRRRDIQENSQQLAFGSGREGGGGTSKKIIFNKWRLGSGREEEGDPRKSSSTSTRKTSRTQKTN